MMCCLGTEFAEVAAVFSGDMEEAEGAGCPACGEQSRAQQRDGDRPHHGGQ